MGKAKKKTNQIGSENEAELIRIGKEKQRLLELKKAEEERHRQWLASWDEKIAALEKQEDCKVCCYPTEYSRDPRIQSNLWYQIHHKRNAQVVQMAFMNVAVPKPPAPPLPKLAPKEEEVKTSDTKSGRKEKKKKKGKK